MKVNTLPYDVQNIWQLCFILLYSCCIKFLSYISVLHPACIVYSKDDDPHNLVRDLSDFLNVCGVECDIDQYHAHENILDWGSWTEELIKNQAARKGYVLLVCSPKLHQQLTNIASNLRKIEMKVGHISNLTLNTLIKDENITNYVIPIFLEQYRKEFIPTCLVGRICYVANITKVPSDGPFIETALNTPELESLRSLVHRLRDEPEVVRPLPQFSPVRTGCK